MNTTKPPPIPPEDEFAKAIYELKMAIFKALHIPQIVAFLNKMLFQK